LQELENPRENWCKVYAKIRRNVDYAEEYEDRNQLCGDVLWRELTDRTVSYSYTYKIVPCTNPNTNQNKYNKVSLNPILGFIDFISNIPSSL